MARLQQTLPLRGRVRFQFSSSQSRMARLKQSLLQRRMARLQHGRGAQAGTGCHEGGIILSKKPPEWHLPRRYIKPLHRAATTNCVRFQFSSSQSRTVPPAVVVVAAKNGPPAAWSWGAGGDKMPRRRHNPKLKAAGVAPVPAATSSRYIELLHRSVTSSGYIERYNEPRPILFFKKKGG